MKGRNSMETNPNLAEQNATAIGNAVDKRKSSQAAIDQQYLPAAKSVSIGGSPRIKKAGQFGIRDRMDKRSCIPEQFPTDEEQGAYLENYNLQEMKEQESKSKVVKWAYVVTGFLSGLAFGRMLFRKS